MRKFFETSAKLIIQRALKRLRYDKIFRAHRATPVNLPQGQQLPAWFLTVGFPPPLQLRLPVPGRSGPFQTSPAKLGFNAATGTSRAHNNHKETNTKKTPNKTQKYHHTLPRHTDASSWQWNKYLPPPRKDLQWPFWDCTMDALEKRCSVEAEGCRMGGRALARHTWEKRKNVF